MLGAVKISVVQAEVALNSPHSCAALKRVFPHKMIRKRRYVGLLLNQKLQKIFKPVHHVDQSRLSAHKKNDSTPGQNLYMAFSQQLSYKNIKKNDLTMMIF